LGKSLNRGEQLFGILTLDGTGQVIDSVARHVVVPGGQLLVFPTKLIASLVQSSSQGPDDACGAESLLFNVHGRLPASLPREPDCLLLGLVNDSLAELARLRVFAGTWVVAMLIVLGVIRA
jgi:hypothetical protein